MKFTKLKINKRFPFILFENREKTDSDRHRKTGSVVDWDLV